METFTQTDVNKAMRSRQGLGHAHLGNMEIPGTNYHVSFCYHTPYRQWMVCAADNQGWSLPTTYAEETFTDRDHILLHANHWARKVEKYLEDETSIGGLVK